MIKSLPDTSFLGKTSIAVCVTYIWKVTIMI
jgi:hypothetical protein